MKTDHEILDLSPSHFLSCCKKYKQGMWLGRGEWRRLSLGKLHFGSCTLPKYSYITQGEQKSAHTPPDERQ